MATETLQQGDCYRCPVGRLRLPDPGDERPQMAAGQGFVGGWGHELEAEEAIRQRIRAAGFDVPRG